MKTWTAVLKTAYYGGIGIWRLIIACRRVNIAFELGLERCDARILASVVCRWRCAAQ